MHTEKKNNHYHEIKILQSFAGESSARLKSEGGARSGSGLEKKMGKG